MGRGRAGKTVTATSGKRSIGLSFHYGKCWTRYSSKSSGRKESGMSGDECRIHALRLFPYGASRDLGLPEIRNVTDKLALPTLIAQRCPEKLRGKSQDG